MLNLRDASACRTRFVSSPSTFVFCRTRGSRTGYASVFAARIHSSCTLPRSLRYWPALPAIRHHTLPQRCCSLSGFSSATVYGARLIVGKPLMREIGYQVSALSVVLCWHPLVRPCTSLCVLVLSVLLCPLYLCPPPFSIPLALISTPARKVGYWLVHACTLLCARIMIAVFLLCSWRVLPGLCCSVSPVLLFSHAKAHDTSHRISSSPESSGHTAIGPASVRVRVVVGSRVT